MSFLIDMRDAFFQVLRDAARQDADIIFLTGDMGAWSLTQFRDEFPDRFINVGIAEQNLVGVAAGLALGGKKPFIYSIVPFVTQRCFEQIKIDVCLMNLPVRILGVGPGLSFSGDGPTHHGIEDLSLMRSLPGMTIFGPCDQASAGAVAKMVVEMASPCYVRLDKGKFNSLYSGTESFSEGACLLKSGGEVLLVASGIMTHTAFQVANRLEASGHSVSVLDMFRIKPLPQSCLQNLFQTHSWVVTLDEHLLTGGLGSAISDFLADNPHPVLLKRFGLDDKFCAQFGDRDWLHAQLGLSSEVLARQIASWLQETKKSSTGPSSVSKTLSENDFANLFGASVAEISQACGDLVAKLDFRYVYLQGPQRELTVVETLHKLDNFAGNRAGPEKQVIWEKGWGENFEEFLAQDGNPEALIPKYYRPGQVMRLYGDFIRSPNPHFEYDFFRVLRRWLFKTRVEPFSTVYEFGCGPGHNLLDLAKTYPKKKVIGLDWAEPVLRIIDAMRFRFQLNVFGMSFDMFQPPSNFSFEPESLVITIGALEQLGQNFRPFLDFLLRTKPARCLHIEPFFEFYRQDSIVDYLALRHHRLRNLLGPFLTSIKQLEKEGRIDVRYSQHLRFGSILEEGWSILEWEPGRCT